MKHESIMRSLPSRITVLHVDHTTAPGGAELALVRSLDRDLPWDWNLVLPDGGDHGVFDVLPTTKLHRIGAIRPAGLTKSGFVPASVELLKLIAIGLRIGRTSAARESDIVHSNSSRSAVYSAVIALVTSKPLIVHLRDAVTVHALGRAGKLLFTRFVLKRAAGVIANSNFTLSTALSYIPSRTVAVVVPSISGLDRRGLISEVPDRPLNIGMVARLDTWKGQELLLRAFASIFTGTEAALHLVGGTSLSDPELPHNLHKLARELGIDSQIVMHGHVDPARVIELIDTMDVCVQASTIAEPMGQNVLQYLARGRPILASDAGGPSEWISHGVNGLLFASGNLESLSKALRQVRAPDLRRKLMEGARATQLPSDEALIADQYDFYRKVLQRWTAK